MDWAQILVIILGVFFAIFLLLAILLAFLLIKITRQIKAATSSAERAVVAMEVAFAGLSKASLPLTISRMLLKQVIKSKTRKQKESGFKEGERKQS